MAKKRKAGRAKVASAARAKVTAPPYKCETADEPGVCLKFYLNPRTGQYNLPPGGERVKCSDCEYFFD